MTSDPTPDDATNAEAFDAAQQQLMVEIGQALIAQSSGGTVAIEVLARQQPESDAGLEIEMSQERQSGLTVPAAADDTLRDAVQRLALLWRDHGRGPWRSFTYRLTRGESGPRFTSEFEL